MLCGLQVLEKGGIDDAFLRRSMQCELCLWTYKVSPFQLGSRIFIYLHPGWASRSVPATKLTAARLLGTKKLRRVLRHSNFTTCHIEKTFVGSNLSGYSATRVGSQQSEMKRAAHLEQQRQSYVPSGPPCELTICHSALGNNALIDRCWVLASPNKSVSVTALCEA